MQTIMFERADTGWMAKTCDGEQLGTAPTLTDLVAIIEDKRMGVKHAPLHYDV